MASGDLTPFNEWGDDVGEKIHNIETDEFKAALIKSAANGGIDPTAATPDPRWGAGGTTNLLSSEVTPGGNYTTGGIAIGASWDRTVNVQNFNASVNPSWAVLAGNPTNARWAIVYN
ncbi:MAG: hypothetical protein ACR2O4_06500, partial [Hyphomicrobiaceae bacterium]